MPAGPVAIRLRHTLRLIRDVVGYWRHNRVRWPIVVGVVALVVLGIALL